MLQLWINFLFVRMSFNWIAHWQQRQTRKKPRKTALRPPAWEDFLTPKTNSILQWMLCNVKLTSSSSLSKMFCKTRNCWCHSHINFDVLDGEELRMALNERPQTFARIWRFLCFCKNLEWNSNHWTADESTDVILVWRVKPAKHVLVLSPIIFPDKNARSVSAPNSFTISLRLCFRLGAISMLMITLKNETSFKSEPPSENFFHFALSPTVKSILIKIYLSPSNTYWK